MTLVRSKLHRRSKLAKKRRKAFLFKLSGIAFLVIALFAGAVYVSQLEEFNIRNISISGNQGIADRAIREFVEEKISGKLLFLFPKSNILLYPRSAVVAALLKEFKGIKEVSIEVEDLESISVNIEERKPYALWCGQEYEIITEEDACYFLDENGFIFTLAPYFSGSVFFRYFGWIGDTPVNEDIIGSQFLNTEAFQRINFFLSALEDIGIVAISLHLVDDKDFEMRLEGGPSAQAGGKILFGQSQNLSFVFDNIQSVFESDEFDKDNLSNLDYADFRFGNKVYFKFK